MQSGDASRELWAAVEVFDGEAAEHALTELLRDKPLVDAVGGVVLPLLREIGERWEDGTLSVAHEHFASNLLRRQLSAVTPGAVRDRAAAGPVVLLACPAGERHDMVLLCFTLLLKEQGIRARFLGADTPLQALAAAARIASADAVVLSATRATALTVHATAIARLARQQPVYVAGRGADEEVADALGARLLPADPIAAGEVLTGDLGGAGQR